MSSLKELIDYFAKTHPNYADPELADGNCGEATDGFMLLADKFGISAEEVHFAERITLADHMEGLTVYLYKQASHRWYDGGCGWGGHIVARVGNTYIDFTARQFDENAPFPLVWEG